MCSNPRPTRRPGATTQAPLPAHAPGCSNPRPTRRPGATLVWSAYHVFLLLFQSSPDPKAGRNVPQTSHELRSTRSNPRPTRRPGATSGGTTRSASIRVRFQSSPDPKAGRNPLKLILSLYLSMFQSSPDPKAGRNLSGWLDDSSDCVFQSSPDPKAGRNRSADSGFVMRAFSWWCANPLTADAQEMIGKHVRSLE